jgi:hypothetical protein
MLPTPKDMLNTVIRSSFAKQLDAIPLSNDTVCRIIQEMASHAKQQPITCVRQSKCIALLVNESNEVINGTILMCFVRSEAGGRVKEEFPFCDNLPNCTSTAETFKRMVILEK